MTENQELIDQLQNIQSQLQDLMAGLREVANADKQNRGWAMAYIIPHLETVISNDHEWMSRDQNIDDWIESLRSPDEEPDEDADYND